MGSTRGLALPLRRGVRPLVEVALAVPGCVGSGCGGKGQVQRFPSCVRDARASAVPNYLPRVLCDLVVDADHFFLTYLIRVD